MMPIKERARSFLASQHGGFFASKVARLAEQYLNAYNNIANWHIETNGELKALRLILGTIDGEIIDVGANVGQWASEVAPFAGANRIHSFEPVPQIFEALQSNIGTKSGVQLVNAGLGSEDKIISVNYNAAVSTISSAFPLIYQQDGAVQVNCRIITGDHYIQEQMIDRVSILKIDIEGMEADCLRGFEQSFTDGKIATVQFEHGPSHVMSGHTLKFFNDWFDERGFDVFLVFPKALKRLRYTLLSENYAGQNLFAIRRDLLPSLGL